MASGLSAAYFGAYFLCPLTISGWILRRFGFRVTFMTGYSSSSNPARAICLTAPSLAILAVGCLLFWPSGVKASFGGFCGSMFVVGAGLSTLGTSADNFLSICGPPRYSEIRLNLAQSVRGIGSFVAPLLAARVFFAKNRGYRARPEKCAVGVPWRCLLRGAADHLILSGAYARGDRRRYGSAGAKYHE